MRISQDGQVWDSIEGYVHDHEQANPLQRTVDDVFSNFTKIVKTGVFECFGDDVNSQEFITALNASPAFKELILDVLVSANLPAENLNMAATAMGYMVFAGYAIRKAEPLQAALTTIN